MSRWTSRIAFFSLAVLGTAALLHRMFGMPTPVAFNLVLVAMAGSLLSFALGLIAAIGIWRSGSAGSARVVAGVFLSILMLMAPMVAVVYASKYPMIYDVSTDTETPPPFVTLATSRGPGDNPPEYPGQRFAREQDDAYPDLKPMTIERSSEETFELVLDALKKLRMDIVRDDAPGEAGEPGAIEAQDRTLIAGLYDDIAIRVSGDETTSRVDIRSASRFGQSDFGRNAERIRLIMQEITNRVHETLPMAEDEPKKKGAAQQVKRGKGAPPKTESRRRPQGRAQ